MPPEQDKSECCKECENIRGDMTNNNCICPCHWKNRIWQCKNREHPVVPCEDCKEIPTVSPLPDKVEEWEKNLAKDFIVTFAGINECLKDVKGTDLKKIVDFFLSKHRIYLSTLKGKVEEMRKEYPSNTFEDGGDPEYRSRREAIESRTTTAFNSALDAVIHLIDTKE